MDSSTTQILAILALVTTLVVLAVLSRRRRRPFALRPIDAYAQMPEIIGTTIEADRPLHLSFGSAGIGGSSTVIALAAAELAYQLTRRAAIGDTSPLLTLSSTSAIPLGQDTLRRAYQQRDLSERYSPTATRWYPAGRRSLAFAAALSAMLSDERVGGSVLAGSYGPELALIMISSQRLQQPVIAVSDQVDGQAIAYALSDKTLIGEEVFTAGAYLGDNPNASSIAVATDVLRWALILAMLGGLISTLGG
ncbi:MAG: DUF6754 domain-containing protein [Phototrophicaceae bacterium]